VSTVNYLFTFDIGVNHTAYLNMVQTCFFFHNYVRSRGSYCVEKWRTSTLCFSS